MKGWGLRGGTFRFTGGGPRIRITLRQDRWASGTRVSGTVTWDQASGRVRAQLTVTGPGGVSASVRLHYLDHVPHPSATLAGHIGGRRIAATMPAP